MTTSLIDNNLMGRFEMAEAGQIVFADYRRAGGRLFIDHVETPMSLRGSGAAGRLMGLIVEQASAERLAIVPICGYAVAWLARHSRDGAAGRL